jgi:cell cycle arrest protein BUB2
MSGGALTDENAHRPKPDFKPLRARKVIDYTVNFARKVPRDLYEAMLVHAK